MRLSMIAVVAGLGLAGCQPTTTPPPTPAPTPLTDAEQNAAREALMAHEGEWDCSAPAPFDRTVRRLLVEDGSASVVSPAGFPGPVVIGGATGATVFRKSGSGWSGYMIDPISSVQAVRYGSAGLYLITKVTREGGGPLGVALLPTGGGALVCAGLASPEALNAPAEHPEFVRLSLDNAGKGSLIAKGEREAKPPLWFRYDTTDAGATWSAAKAIPGPAGTDLDAPDQTKVPAALAREIAAS
ncbi:MAG: hypothetical protein KA085_07635 [Phenylobacterium sp.]|uniref:hypothetical protein n=1 Tax=Phenylobacterium sp. TaxID=1871053 RepID=UPI001B6A7C5E|nr:hypothetical protein [Phenylobacterium sp.]MBP7815979.1 hypothetical protein [Phenylobacterium sp.]MBP9755120.1 hypothetical protein [Phenylobacterium sp.]